MHHRVLFFDSLLYTQDKTTFESEEDAEKDTFFWRKQIGKLVRVCQQYYITLIVCQKSIDCELAAELSLLKVSVLPNFGAKNVAILANLSGRNVPLLNAHSSVLDEGSWRGEGGIRLRDCVGELEVGFFTEGHSLSGDESGHSASVAAVAGDRAFLLVRPSVVEDDDSSAESSTTRSFFSLFLNKASLALPVYEKPLQSAIRTALAFVCNNVESESVDVGAVFELARKRVVQRREKMASAERCERLLASKRKAGAKRERRESAGGSASSSEGAPTAEQRAPEVDAHAESNPEKPEKSRFVRAFRIPVPIITDLNFAHASALAELLERFGKAHGRRKRRRGDDAELEFLQPLRSCLESVFDLLPVLLRLRTAIAL